MRKESLDLILIITSVGDIYGSNFGGEKKALANDMERGVGTHCEMINFSWRKDKKISMNVPTLPPHVFVPYVPFLRPVFLTFIKDSSDAKPGASSFICIISLNPHN